MTGVHMKTSARSLARDRLRCLSRAWWIVSLSALTVGVSCSKNGVPELGSGSNGGVPTSGSSAGGVSGVGGSSGVPGTGGSTSVSVSLDASVAPVDTAAAEVSVCKTEQVQASIEPTRLAFVFDVSGSMGQGDFPWHDKTLKWDPVVSATKGFFSDPSSRGIEASLVFFPTKDDNTKCLAATYATPNVPMTVLPSGIFGTAIDAQSPPVGDGTPTVAVVEGTLTYVRAQRAAKPGKYALVLATDGYPQDCGSDNTIANAAQTVAGALKDGISTYVIGVRNPPITGAPDVTSNLNQIATAGGTTVFFLDTGTPSATQKALSTAIDQIRGAAISCDIAIPAPPAGRTFDKEKVVLTYTSGTKAPVALTYDASCASANSWHYDNAVTPTHVVLCASTCSTVQADANAVLNVGFACEQIISVIP
jgi:von Willebrand factor type A domain